MQFDHSCEHCGTFVQECHTSNREEHPRMLLLLREAQHAADTPPHGGVAAGVRGRSDIHYYYYRTPTQHTSTTGCLSHLLNLYLKYVYRCV